MSNIEIESTIQIGTMTLSDIVLKQLTASFRTLLVAGAEKVCENFNTLIPMDDESRLEEILKLFGVSNEEIVKIKPSKPRASKTESTDEKPKGKRTITKPFPLPFHPSLVDPAKCQALTGKLKTQCSGKKVDGFEYCSKCKKIADSNDGRVTAGDVRSRVIQYNTSINVNGKQLNKYFDYHNGEKTFTIYYARELEKTNHTLEEAFQKLAEKGVDLSEPGLRERLSYAPPKKEKKVSKPKAERKPKKNARPGDDSGYESSASEGSETEYEIEPGDRPGDFTFKFKLGEKIRYRRRECNSSHSLHYGEIVEHNYENGKYTVKYRDSTRGTVFHAKNVEEEYISYREPEPVPVVAEGEKKSKSEYKIADFEYPEPGVKTAILRAQYGDKTIKVINVYRVIGGNGKDKIIVDNEPIGQLHRDAKDPKSFSTVWNLDVPMAPDSDNGLNSSDDENW
jgi:hypothetical protein